MRRENDWWGRRKLFSHKTQRFRGVGLWWGGTHGVSTKFFPILHIPWYWGGDDTLKYNLRKGIQTCCAAHKIRHKVVELTVWSFDYKPTERTMYTQNRRKWLDAFNTGICVGHQWLKLFISWCLWIFSTVSSSCNSVLPFHGTMKILTRNDRSYPVSGHTYSKFGWFVNKNIPALLHQHLHSSWTSSTTTVADVLCTH